MPRDRFLLVGAAPFLALSLLPLALSAALGWTTPVPAFLALVNCLSSAVDFAGLFVIGFQAPRRARVRNFGWRTYWRMP